MTLSRGLSTGMFIAALFMLVKNSATYMFHSRDLEKTHYTSFSYLMK